ncbi:MAG: HAD-IIIA family hydrolase [Candidatus Bipolaricaulota bacterium]
MRFLRAREIVDTVFDVDYDRLWARGCRALLFDLDNTLGARGLSKLDADVGDLLRGLTARGFSVGILTNRKRTASDGFARALAEEFAVLDVARKPSRRGYDELLRRLGRSAAAAAMIGDRRLTDILGANRSGIYSVRVRGVRRSTAR